MQAVGEQKADIRAELAALAGQIAASGGSSDGLESRLRRLEDALAAMQDSQLMEERLADRVLDRLVQAPALRSLRPASAPESPRPARTVLELPPSRGPDGPPSTAAAPERPLPPPATGFPGPAAFALPGPAQSAVQSGWLLLELWNDLRNIVAMYFDYRYRVGLVARYAPWVYAVLVVTIWAFCSPWLSTIYTLLMPLEKIMNIALTLVLYKILVREAARYRERVDYMPPSY